MRAEYAAGVTRRYSTFVKVPAGVRILKSASGPSDEDYHWMEVRMRNARGRFTTYYVSPSRRAAK